MKGGNKVGNEGSVVNDAIRDKRKKREIAKKVIVAVISIAAIIVGELAKEENDTNIAKNKEV